MDFVLALRIQLSILTLAANNIKSIVQLIVRLVRTTQSTMSLTLPPV